MSQMEDDDMEDKDEMMPVTMPGYPSCPMCESMNKGFPMTHDARSTSEGYARQMREYPSVAGETSPVKITGKRR